MTNHINQNVTLTSVRFTHQFEIIPRRIEFNGVSYDLTEEARPADDHTLEISDGTRLFRLLRGLTTSDWKLLSITL
jgi:hypothetical protein